jgi:hypothetical protein
MAGKGLLREDGLPLSPEHAVQARDLGVILALMAFPMLLYGAFYRDWMAGLAGVLFGGFSLLPLQGWWRYNHPKKTDSDIQP